MSRGGQCAGRCKGALSQRFGCHGAPFSHAPQHAPLATPRVWEALADETRVPRQLERCMLRIHNPNHHKRLNAQKARTLIVSEHHDYVGSALRWSSVVSWTMDQDQDEAERPPPYLAHLSGDLAV